MKRIFFISLLATLFCACTNAQSKQDDKALTVSDETVLKTSILYSRDSLMHYAELALTKNDPKAQYITAAAYYLQKQGDIPGVFYTGTQEEADELLMLSAGQQYQPAIEAISCLKKCGMWKH